MKLGIKWPAHWPAWTQAAAAATALAATGVGIRAVTGGGGGGGNEASSPKWEEPDKDKPSTTNITVPSWRFTTVSAGTSDMRTFDVSAAKAEIAQKCQNLTPDVALELFKKYSFHEFEHLSKQKAILPEHSMKLAEFRRGMIEAALADLNLTLDKGVTVGLLDSGNRNGGIGSDIDQTLMLMPRELGEKLKLTEARLIEMFTEKFEARWKFHPDHAGIETMNGADFFPDWKQAHEIGWMVNEYGRVAADKRSNKEAYHSEAMLKIQVEGRHREVIEDHHKRMSDLVAERDRVDNEATRLQADATLTEAQKAAQIEELRKGVTAMEAEVKRLSPWLEAGWDFSKNPPEPKITWFEDPKDRITLNAENLEKRMGFDGTWDNWVAAENHPHNRSKYLLRGTGQGIGLMRQGGESRVFTTTFDYEKMYQAGHRDLCENFVKNTYPGMTPEEHANIIKALDVAAKQRIQHGSKNTAYPPAEVWQEYIADLPEAARKTMPEASLIEAAKGRWQVQARDLMLENMLRAVSEPARLMNGGITTAEFAEITSRCPDATPKKLDAAVREQFYNAFHDLMSIDHAKQLAGSAEAKAEVTGKRGADLVDRLLQKIAQTSPEIHGQLEGIARDVALKRVAVEPGLQQHRVTTEFYQFAKESLKAKFAGPGEVYQQARQMIDSGKYSTREAVGKLMLEHSMRRVAGLGGDILTSAGFSGRIQVLAPTEDGHFPALELEFNEPKFSGTELMTNMASLGNLDSVLQVLSVYQDQGPLAAAWQAVQQIVMNVPEIAFAAALVELAKTGNPKSLFMLGSVFMIPGVGEAYMLVSIGTTTVKLIGTYVVNELGNDTADMAYQGFIGAERGFTKDVASQRFSILAPVKLTVVKNTLTPPDGRQYPVLAVADIFNDDRALELGLCEPGENTEWMRKDHLLGGGPLWEQALASINETEHPREAFEAKRLSLFYHYEQDLAKLAKDKDFELSDKDKARPILTEWCLAKVESWITGSGEYAGIIDGENEIIARKFTPEVRAQIAKRMADDILRSFAILRRDETLRDLPSVEKDLRSTIIQERRNRLRFEANQGILALHDAWQHKPDPAMADAEHLVVSRRKIEARKPQPKIHLRARVLDLKRLKELEGFEASPDGAGNSAASDFVECSVSVVADPEAFPPPYHYDTLWDVKPKGKVRLVTARVKVFDSKNQPVGDATQEIGTLEGDDSASDGPTVRFAQGQYQPYFAERRSRFLQLAEPGDLRKLPQFKAKPASFDRVYGIAFYRRFDEPQPDQELRFKPGSYGGGFSLANEADAIYSSPATSKKEVQLIGKMSWPMASAYQPPDLEHNSLALRPMDPSDPRASRSYAYSLIYYNGPANQRFKAKAEDLSESDFSSWTHCETVPLMCYVGDKGQDIPADPGQRYSFVTGSQRTTPGVKVCAFLRLNDELQIPQYFLDWRDLLPDAQPHYIYHFKTPGEDRYALSAAWNNTATWEADHGSHTAFQAPGITPLEVSIQIGKQHVVAHFDVTRNADENWSRALKAVEDRRLRLEEALKRYPQSKVDYEKSPGLADINLAESYRILSDTQLQIGDITGAEKNALTALDLWKQGSSLYAAGRHENKYGRQLAKIYFAWDRPGDYLVASQVALDASKQLRADIPGQDTEVSLGWRDIASEHFNMTGDHPMLRVHMQNMMATAPPGKEEQPLLPEYWEDPRTYRSPTDQPVTRVKPRVLDPDPLK